MVPTSGGPAEPLLQLGCTDDDHQHYGREGPIAPIFRRNKRFGDES